MEESKDRVVKRFDELGFTVVAEPDDYRVYYGVYIHEGVSEKGDPLYHEAGSSTYPCPVEAIEEAEAYLHGEVKWDGSSNWYFDEQERRMLHGCDKQDILRLGQILVECWDWTSELCERFLK